MNISSKLFDVINDVPVYTPVLLNIPCFKRLYALDNSEDKSLYAKQLAYIWYLNDLKSPYKDSADKENDAMSAAFGQEVNISDELQECIDEYIKRQTTSESRALDASMRVCDDLVKLLQTRNNKTQEYDRLLEDMEKALAEQEDIASRFTIMKAKLELENEIMARSKTIADIIPKITVLAQSISEARKKIDKISSDIDSSSNRENISNFIINDVINKFR